MRAPGGVNAQPMAVAASSLPTAQSPNRRLIAAVVVLALALIGVLAWTLGGKLLQKSGTSEPSQLVQAPGKGAPGSLVQAPGAGDPNALVQAPATGQTPPIVQAGSQQGNADIEDYLKFLKQIELTKMQLTKEEMASVLNIYGNMTGREAEAAQSDEDAKTFMPNLKKQFDFAPQWNELTSKFAARTPPPACIDLRNKYLDYLGKTQGVLAQLMDGFSKAMSGDPSDALKVVTSMQGSASAEIDAGAKVADDELASICGKYHLVKDFSIQTDPSSFSGLMR